MIPPRSRWRRGLILLLLRGHRRHTPSSRSRTWRIGRTVDPDISGYDDDPSVSRWWSRSHSTSSSSLESSSSSISSSSLLSSYSADPCQRVLWANYTRNFLSLFRFFSTPANVFIASTLVDYTNQLWNIMSTDPQNNVFGALGIGPAIPSSISYFSFSLYIHAIFL